jgi:hypothetical protein
MYESKGRPRRIENVEYVVEINRKVRAYLLKVAAQDGTWE